MYTSSQCLCSSLCHSSLCSVKFPFTYNSDSGFLHAFLFPGAKQHFTKCSSLALLACFFNTLLVITIVHFVAASSRILTSSAVRRGIFPSPFLCKAPPHQRQLQKLLFCDQMCINLVFFILHHFLHEFNLQSTELLDVIFVCTHHPQFHIEIDHL